MEEQKEQGVATEPKNGTLVARGVVGGVMMGLANLVPGISGGTMLLASGVYPRFIQAIAELTTLKFRLRSLLVLGAVVVSAGVAILLLAGPVKDLVVGHRWVMYSLFIGLTFGGVPIVWKMARPVNRNVWAGAVVGFVVMAAVALLQAAKVGASSGSEGSNVVMMFVAGLAGAGAMILPGISGGYLLLVLGQYVKILAGIEQFKDALKAMAIPEMMHVGLTIILPIGLGVVIGVVVVSNVLKFLLKKYEKTTLGVLLGLLLGAVIGLWPFQEGVPPQGGDVMKGQVLTEETLAAVDPDDYNTRPFTPTAGQMGGCAALILAGFACTCLVARIGGGEV
ncbi:MAG: DUF368 domain-containing protein [Kiritimatiellae bacterium]|nr:DUF368 domain-containing protein [Kiritimatiellia bacterium]